MLIKVSHDTEENPSRQILPHVRLRAEVVVSHALLRILPALMLMFTKGCGCLDTIRECNWEGKKKISYKWIRFKVYKLLWTFTLVYSLMLIWIMKSVTFPKMMTIIASLQKLYLGRGMAVVTGGILKQNAWFISATNEYLGNLPFANICIMEGRGSEWSDFWIRDGLFL